MGSIGGWGGIKRASASTPSAIDQAKDLISVLTVQLKTSDVETASVHSEKTCLKKLRMKMNIIIIIIIMNKS